MPHQDILNLRGEQGGEFIDDTAAHPLASELTADWAAMVVIEAAVLSAITMPTFGNSAAIVGPTLAAGSVIYGEITSVTLASGTVQMFSYLTERVKAALQHQ
jgi:hypothetical protein